MNKPKKAKESDFTTFKVRRKLAQKISQLASLLDVTIPEVIDRYEKLIDEDLFRELAKRQAELREDRPSLR